MTVKKSIRNRNWKRSFVLFFIVVLASLMFGQNKTISGVVKDATGETIISASVIVKGTNIGTVTNVNGEFKLNVPTSAKTLVVSYIGMKTKEVAISGGVINVSLEDDSKMLDEVVAIGYGTAKRKDITGSVASVSAETLASIPVTSAVEAISGKLAGVQITTTEGSPDAEVKIRVRGGGSITGDNKPLFVVDGFPVESISDIAPSDIESIDVLKDASSTAIYGSRGANGVIIVTTKSGKEGKITVNYNAFTSFKKMANRMEVLNASDYAKWQYELALLKDDGKADSYEKFFGSYGDIDLYDNVATNDWQNLVFGRTGFTFNHNLSINGGTEKSKFSFNYSSVNDKAIMQLSSFNRDNLNFKFNTKASKNITLDFSSRYSNTAIYGGGANEQKEVSSADSRLKHAIIYTPFPIKDLTTDTGSDDDTEVGNLYNPLVNISDNDQIQRRKTFNMAGAITWEILKGLKAKAEVGYDDYTNKNDRYYGMTTYYIKNVPASLNQNHPAIILANTDRSTIRSTNTLNYDFKKVIKDKNHNLSAMLGQEYIFAQSGTLTSTVHGFPTSFSSEDAFKLSTQGYAYSIDNNFTPDEKMLSFFSRANYDYKSRYLVSATFRADGSSKFSKGHRWGYFPSAAVAWRVSSEEFMGGTRDWLDDLKLRVSYGTAGNDKIPSGQMTQSFESRTSSWINNYSSYWSASKVMANPNLKWETTVTRNIGLDFTLLNSKLSGTVEGYWNSTTDLLINFPTPGTGYDSQYRNMGETRNRGVELTLNWMAIDKKNYGLSFSGNIGFNHNKILSLGLMNNFGSSSGWASTEIGTDYWVEKFGSVGKMYGYVSDGRYEVSDFTGYNETTKKWILKDGVSDATGVVGALRPGSMKLKNVVGEDNLITVADRKVIGDANPLHTGGLTLNGRLYGFDLSASFNWSFGNDIYNANKIEYTSTSKYQYRNMTSVMESGQRWTNLKDDGTISNNVDELSALNENTTLWSPYMARYVFSDWAVEDGSFLRLNTLSLGYTLPKKISYAFKVSNLRLYTSVYNVFCLTNYSGPDPEVSTRRQTSLTPGVDYSAYPKSRQLIVGINLSF
ncbi:MAG: SusC/RagA family TonB-linked outer membrane protein [Paludibacter sp.]